MSQGHPKADSVDHPESRSIPNDLAARRRAEITITASVVGSYAIKACAKFAGGIWAGSTPLIADAAHGVLDILEHLGIKFAGSHARKPDLENFPLGREPLMNLVSVGVYLGCLLLAFSTMWAGIQTILELTGLDSKIFQLGSDGLEDVKPTIASFQITLIVLMLGSSLLSWQVYRCEIRLAREHRLIEFEADAAELANDIVVEVGIASCLIIQIIVVWLVAENAPRICRLVDAVILIGLGSYILTKSLPDLREHYRILMNRSLPRADRLRLESILTKRMPRGCCLKKPLTAYVRGGNSIFVSGWIMMERGMTSTSDVIAQRCNRIVELYFGDVPETVVNVQFGVVTFYTEPSIQRDWDRLLREVWEVEPGDRLGRAFCSFKHGRLQEARDQVQGLVSTTPHEKTLKGWLSLELARELREEASSDRMESGLEFSDLVETAPSTSTRCMLCASELIRLASSQGGDDSHDQSIESLRERLLELLRDEQNVQRIVEAESRFALGFSWYRSSDFDIARVTAYFEQAASLYAESGIRSEEDRLKTSWGHLKALLFELGDAIILLEESRVIKEQKGDAAGLAYVYGCLGDAYSRWGKFDLAGHFFSEDLRLCRELGTTHAVPGVMVKEGEAKIRRGLIEREDAWIVAGLARCREAQNAVDETNAVTAFFATKGCAKATMALASLATETADRDQWLERADALTRQLTACDSYQEALRCRLIGRLNGMRGQNAVAVQWLNRAEAHFAELTGTCPDETGSIQALACRLEAARFEMPGKENDMHTLDEVLDELMQLAQRLRGLLGKTGTRIQQYIEELRKTAHTRPASTADDSLIERLIALLEG